MSAGLLYSLVHQLHMLPPLYINCTFSGYLDFSTVNLGVVDVQLTRVWQSAYIRTRTQVLFPASPPYHLMSREFAAV